MPVLDYLYKKYSGKKTLPGKKKFMCLEEFYTLCSQANLLDFNLVDREVAQAFGLSMMTQKDELFDRKIFEMNIYEFFEALGRVAEEYSAVPTGLNVIIYNL